MDDVTTDEDEEDVRLMLQAAGDDNQAAFEKLVIRHQKKLLNFFIRSGVYTDTEDLVQQTFIRLYRYRDRYSPRAKFTTFLYLIARQVRVDEIRKRIRLQRIRDRAQAQAEIDEPITEDVHPNVTHDDLQVALDKLSAAHRDVVVLGMLQEIPYQEIAKILHIPVGTVKSRMHHALKQLRELI